MLLRLNQHKIEAQKSLEEVVWEATDVIVTTAVNASYTGCSLSHGTNFDS